MRRSWGRGLPTRFGNATACRDVVVLDVFRCVRRTRRGEAAVLWRLRPDRGRRLAEACIQRVQSAPSARDQRIEVIRTSALVTRASDGALVIACGICSCRKRRSAKTITLRFKDLRGSKARVQIYRVDSRPWIVVQAYEAMGSRLSDAAQIAGCAALRNCQRRKCRRFQAARLRSHLPPHGLALIELQ